MHAIPERFVRITIDLFDEEGKIWLQNLPTLLATYEQRWSISVLPPFSNLSYNYVAPAVRADGTPVIIKTGVPNDELLREIAALQIYDGHGIARLLEADPDNGIMLLEQLTPGTTLLAEVQARDDEQATIIAAEVMRELWRPVPPGHSFPTVAHWAKGMNRLRAEFDGGTGPFPNDLVELAEQLFAELLATMDTPVLLHGDLHHENILAAERRPWLAIDPKGIVGEPAYEIGALLRNPLPQLLEVPHPERVTARRVDILAERLGIDRARIIDWGLAQAVLSAWWSYEDHGHGWEPAIACARLLEGLRG